MAMENHETAVTQQKLPNNFSIGQ